MHSNGGVRPPPPRTATATVPWLKTAKPNDVKANAGSQSRVSSRYFPPSPGVAYSTPCGEAWHYKLRHFRYYRSWYHVSLVENGSFFDGCLCLT